MTSRAIEKLREHAELTPAGRRILDAAEELFFAQGLTSVGVDTIAATAGVTKKTLYDCFGSKDALITAYLVRRDERYRAWVERYVARRAGQQDKVLAVFDALAAWMRRNGPRGCAFVNAAAEMPDPEHPAHQVSAEQKRWLTALFRELLGTRRSDHTAEQLALLHEGAIVMYSVGHDRGAMTSARQAAGMLLAAHAASAR